MKKYVPILFVYLITSFSSKGQQSFEEKMKSLYKNTVPLVQADSIKDRLDELVLLDTRAPIEYEISHLPGARLVDYDTYRVKDLNDIPKDTEIVVYCSVGYRSERVGEKLKKAGYKNVKNLYGGIFDWKNSGNKVVKSNNQPTDSVHTYNKAWSRWLYKGIKVYE